MGPALLVCTCVQAGVTGAVRRCSRPPDEAPQADSHPHLGTILGQTAGGGEGNLKGGSEVTGRNARLVLCASAGAVSGGYPFLTWLQRSHGGHCQRHEDQGPLPPCNSPVPERLGANWIWRQTSAPSVPRERKRRRLPAGRPDRPGANGPTLCPSSPPAPGGAACRTGCRGHGASPWPQFGL